MSYFCDMYVFSNNTHAAFSCIYLFVHVSYFYQLSWYRLAACKKWKKCMWVLGNVFIQSF